ncbi:MAG: lipoyl protein ligase domain-containing protein [Bacillota bacterium]
MNTGFSLERAQVRGEESLKLFRLGLVPAAFSQAVYHVLAREGVEALIILSPAEKYVCVGYFQNPRASVDVEYCRAKGIPVFRREVGGGAVLLDSGQVFYQLVLRSDNPVLPPTVMAMYEKFSWPPVQTYRRFGIPAFHRPVNDIVTGSGRKISGQGGADIGPCQVFVGNIILDFDYETMSRALKVPDEKLRDKVYKTMRQNLTTMKNELGTLPDREAVEDVLVEEFSKLLDPLEESSLPQGIMPKIHEMGRWLQSEAFVFACCSRSRSPVKVREGLFLGRADVKAPGGLVSVDVTVEEGTIKELALYGDFTLRPKDSFLEISRALQGATADPMVLRGKVEGVYRLRSIESPGVSPEHIAMAVMKACGKGSTD